MKNAFFIISLLFSFSCFAQTDTLHIKDTTVNEEYIYTKVDQMPVFPGGEAEMMKYIQRNVKYPKSERNHNISGTCYATFVVEKDGSISNLKILRGVPNGPGLDAETIRVIGTMPKWNPGKEQGENARVQFNLPIRFVL